MPDLSTIVLVTVVLVMAPCFVCAAKKSIAVMHKSYGPAHADSRLGTAGMPGGIDVACPLCAGSAARVPGRGGLHKCDTCNYQFEAHS